MVSIPSPESFHHSRIYQGQSERLGLWVSQRYKCPSFLSHPCTRDALYAAFSDPILGLYTDNASAPLNVRAGLRQLYRFGLYSHCAYVNETAGLCANITAGYEFRPYTVITNDMLSNYSGYTTAIIHNATFANSSSLGGSTRAAYYLLLLGAIVAVFSLVMSVRSCYRHLVLAHLCFAQGCDQIYLVLPHIHIRSRRRKHIRSRWFGPLDSCHQESGGHQCMDSQRTICRSSSWYRGFCRDWAIPCVGGIRLLGG